MKNKYRPQFVNYDICSVQNKRCLDKKGAQTAVNASMRKFHGKMRYYHCEECNWWHLASINPKKVR